MSTKMNLMRLLSIIFFDFSAILYDMKPLIRRSIFMPEYPLVIKKEAVYTLSECLSALSKTQQLILANEIMPPSFDAEKYTKAKLIPILTAEIQRRILYAFQYLHPFVSAFFVGFVYPEKFSDILKNFKEIEQSTIPRHYLEILAAQILIESGFCFGFLPKGKRTVQYVVPQELHIIAAHMAESLSADNAQPVFYIDFLPYAEILSSLYGICPVDMFMQIYNRDVQNPIEDKQEFLWRMEEAATMSNVCYFAEDSIVSVFIPYAAYNTIRLNIESLRQRFQPYIPSPEEMTDRLFCTSYEEKTGAYQQCTEWFTRYMKDECDPYDITARLCSYIKLAFPFERQLDVLEAYLEAHDSDFQSVPEENRKLLLPILQELNVITRHWELWGHTPDEVSLKEPTNIQTAGERMQKAEHPMLAILPKGSRIPSEEDYNRQRQLFDEYCDYGNNLPWWSKGPAAAKKIAASYKKIAHVFDKMPEDNPEELIDQWLASLWHKGANRQGHFGSQQWNYAVFRPFNKLAENVFCCQGHDGALFVVYSKLINIHFEENLTGMSVLIDMGGWYLLYGPVVFWRGLSPFDFIALAKQVAPQMYKEQGLNAVIQFNPCPFWALTYLANKPPYIDGDTVLVECSLECAFIDNVIPQLSKSWSMESVGNYTRWTYDKKNYVNSRRIYYNHKTHEVLLSAHCVKTFDKLLRNVRKYLDFDEKHSDENTEKKSLLLVEFWNDVLKYPDRIAQLDKKFKK